MVQINPDTYITKIYAGNRTTIPARIMSRAKLKKGMFVRWQVRDTDVLVTFFEEKSNGDNEK